MIHTLISLASKASRIVDLFERVTKNNMDIPPYSLRRLIGAPPLDFSGDEYRAEGLRFREHLVNAGGLRNGMTVGEIGCGCGRMAVPILDAYDVAYYGFDIVPSLVEWLKSNVGPVHKRADFHFINVWNSRYNPTGTVKTDDITFPFPAAECDLIYASSVFTHILTETTGRYLAEIKRTLAPEGRAVVTAFLLDIAHPEKHGAAQAAAGVDARLGKAPSFSYVDSGIAHYVYADVPELMVGYNLAELSKMAEERGLKTSLYSAGSWKHGGASKSWQDIVVFTHA